MRVAALSIMHTHCWTACPAGVGWLCSFHRAVTFLRYDITMIWLSHNHHLLHLFCGHGDHYPHRMPNVAQNARVFNMDTRELALPAETKD